MFDADNAACERYWTIRDGRLMIARDDWRLAMGLTRTPDVKARAIIPGLADFVPPENPDEETSSRVTPLYETSHGTLERSHESCRPGPPGICLQRACSDR